MTYTRIACWTAVTCLAITAVASCAASGKVHGSTGTGSGGSGAGPGAATATGSGGAGVGGSLTVASASASTGTGGEVANHCMPPSSDFAGCTCATNGETRVCYPQGLNPKTRNVGTCKDGQQTCETMGEFSTWGACTGAIGPSIEVCDDGLDNDCNGLADCMDPSCAGDPMCNGGCTDGMTEPCYDGPPGTLNVGTCRSGTKTCVNGMWSAGCPGEVLPVMEVCSDFLDHNCNGLPGCFDFLVCFNDPACMPMCTPPAGCSCPMGSGDAATCPDGTYGDVNSDACCPCTADTCDQLGCCGEAVCAGAAACGGLVCAPLPAACGGMVSQDCDWEDLASSDAQNPPEDCDMPCCKCRPPICP